MKTQRINNDNKEQETAIDDEHKRRVDQLSNITDEEKRMGMRATLRQFQRECANCKQTPVSMVPSECGVCGNFKRRKL